LQKYIPTLRLADGKVIAGAHEIVETIATEFKLTQEDIAEPNGDGAQSKVVNNASFSLVHCQSKDVRKD
jgi:hypothetical protein